MPLLETLSCAAAKALGLGAVTGPSSLTYVTYASSTSSTITIPSHNAGDLIVLWNFAYNSYSTYPTAVVPSGFTQISNITGIEYNSNYYCRGIASYKVSDGSTGSVSVMLTGNNWSVLMIYRPDAPISTVTVGSLVAANYSSNPYSAISAGGTFPKLDVSCCGSWNNSYRSYASISTAALGYTWPPTYQSQQAKVGVDIATTIINSAGSDATYYGNGISGQDHMLHNFYLALT